MTKPSTTPDGWEVARQWQAYARAVEEQRDMLVTQLRYLVNVTHENHHTTHWPEPSETRTAQDLCTSVVCMQAISVLRSVNEATAMQVDARSRR